ncbi:MAG: hypothetical protein J0H64_06165, partial [Actinobacteria bacterium]|nr:hypothetical protein [Actinomycetota bacterium]
MVDRNEEHGKATGDDAETVESEHGKSRVHEHTEPSGSGVSGGSGDALDRVIARAGAAGSATVIRDLSGGARSEGLLSGGQAQALGDAEHDRIAEGLDAIRLEREERA